MFANKLLLSLEKQASNAVLLSCDIQADYCAANFSRFITCHDIPLHTVHREQVTLIRDCFAVDVLWKIQIFTYPEFHIYGISMFHYSSFVMFCWFVTRNDQLFRQLTIMFSCCLDLAYVYICNNYLQEFRIRRKLSAFREVLAKDLPVANDHLCLQRESRLAKTRLN